MEEFISREKEMCEGERKTAERNLQAIEQNLEQFREEASQALQQKQELLIRPLLKTISLAISDAAKENQFDFVFNPQSTGSDFLLYADEKYDLSNIFLKNLVPPDQIPKTPPQGNDLRRLDPAEAPFRLTVVPFISLPGCVLCAGNLQAAFLEFVP
jgi:signal transduction histidine kinase